MDEKRAREIIGDEEINEDNTFCINNYNWTEYNGDNIILDGDYNAEELEAFAWWIKNKGK